MDIRGPFRCFVQSLLHSVRRSPCALIIWGQLYVAHIPGCHNYGPFVGILAIKGRTTMRTKKVRSFENLAYIGSHRAI